MLILRALLLAVFALAILGFEGYLLFDLLNAAEPDTTARIGALLIVSFIMWQLSQVPKIFKLLRREHREGR